MKSIRFNFVETSSVIHIVKQMNELYKKEIIHTGLGCSAPPHGSTSGGGAEDGGLLRLTSSRSSRCDCWDVDWPFLGGGSPSVVLREIQLVRIIVYVLKLHSAYVGRKPSIKFR